EEYETSQFPVEYLFYPIPDDETDLIEYWDEDDRDTITFKLDLEVFFKHDLDNEQVHKFNIDGAQFRFPFYKSFSKLLLGPVLSRVISPLFDFFDRWFPRLNKRLPFL